MPPLPRLFSCLNRIGMHFIQVGEGNAGASALLWNVAQQTSIRNVSIDLSRSGLIGLDVSGDVDVLAYYEHGA